MKENNNYAKALREALPVGQSFDVLERNIQVGGRPATMFFVDGLVNGEVMPIVMSYLLNVTRENAERAKTAAEFLELNLPFLDALVAKETDKAVKQILSGLVGLRVQGMDDTIIIDVRDYPNRSVEEPQKEKSLRGAKDGFTETFMTNIALIRRRIRSPELIFKAYVIGADTQNDVSLVYLKGKADEAHVKKVEQKLQRMSIEKVSVGDQTIVESLLYEKRSGKTGRRGGGWLNPFPKVRYTQRPDVAAAHISEGKLAVIIDTSPTVVLLPTSVFEFVQDVDDYYFPALTGNYFRLIRIINILAILFLTPAYLMMAEGYATTYEALRFFIPEEPYAIPIFWQFILLEIAVDALKLASLNTPDSLGMSLSVIGALILGEFSIETGWFIPHTILCMAVVALASFTQPSIELGYALKFVRILLLVGIGLGGLWGLTGAWIGVAAALIISIATVATTKSILGTSYIYPLVPFNWNALKHLMFRTAR